MPQKPYFKVRNSRIHGRGAFAVRRIRPGTRIIEYTGEHISNREADRRSRLNGHLPNDHTFLFGLDDKTTIDASVGGNDARFINHSCDPNCETIYEGDHIYIHALKNIQPGVELSYDYQLTGPNPRTIKEWSRYICRCGAPNCRGTMLEIKMPKAIKKKLKKLGVIS